jgi:hypothetical protein
MSFSRLGQKRPWSSFCLHPFCLPLLAHLLWGSKQPCFESPREECKWQGTDASSQQPVRNGVPGPTIQQKLNPANNCMNELRSGLSTLRSWDDCSCLCSPITAREKPWAGYSSEALPSLLTYTNQEVIMAVLIHKIFSVASVLFWGYVLRSSCFNHDPYHIKKMTTLLFYKCTLYLRHRTYSLLFVIPAEQMFATSDHLLLGDWVPFTVFMPH